jgi:hypothetical protein
MPREAFRLAEFRALRATIRERGTTRVVLVTVACVAWASLAAAIVLVAPLALLLVLPLIVLSAGFEVNVGMHLAIERIGRYLQVAFEEPDGGWETATLEFARRFPLKGGVDPLFFWVFGAAVGANFLCVLLTNAEPTDLGVVTVVHLAVLMRFVFARRFASAQRDADLVRFRELLRPGEDTRPPV